MNRDHTSGIDDETRETVEDNFGDGAASALVIALIQQSARDTAHTTNALLNGYREDALTARATLAAVRDQVSMLLHGDYMPTPVALLRALHPSAAIVNSYRQQGEG